MAQDLGDIEKLSVEGGEDIVTPWDVSAEEVTGIDYAKLIGKVLIGFMRQSFKHVKPWLPR